jgi:hypothetical protein
LPGLPRGRCGLSAFQASSDSQNKLFAMTIAPSDSNQAQIYNQNSINCMSSLPSLTNTLLMLAGFKGGAKAQRSALAVPMMYSSLVTQDPRCENFHIVDWRRLHRSLRGSNISEATNVDISRVASWS